MNTVKWHTDQAHQLVAQYPDTPGAHELLTATEKDLHEYQNKMHSIKKNKRTAYGVDISEKIHPSFLNQAKSRNKSHIPDLGNNLRSPRKEIHPGSALDG